MTAAFAILAVITLASAVATMTLRNLVHCALALAVTFAGLAGFYVQLDAPFVGLSQILVYVGAVAILIVFAILLTRSHEPSPPPAASSSWIAGVGIATLAFGALAATALASSVVLHQPRSDVAASAAVKQIGTKLMTEYVLPLEVIALLLTAALIGAVIIAMHETTSRSSPNGTKRGTNEHS